MFIIFTLLEIFLPPHVVHVDDISIAIDVKDLVNDCFNEVDIVRDDDEPAGIFAEIFAQPVDGFSIKVVGRFIED